MAKTLADELLEALQAHRQNRLQPPPPPDWTVVPDEVQWSGDEGESKETSD